MTDEIREVSELHPFVVRHYTDDERPSIKGNGFDGLEVGENRQEAEEFIAWINARLCLRRPAPAPAPAPAADGERDHVPGAGNMVAADGEREELAQWLERIGDDYDDLYRLPSALIRPKLARAAALLRKARPQPPQGGEVEQ